VAFQHVGTVVANRPAADVYRFLVDPVRDTTWRRPYVVSCRAVMPGPVAVGSRYETIYRFFGVKTRAVVEITEDTAPQLFAWKQVSQGRIVTIDGRYVLEPLDGRTRVTIHQSARTRGLVRLVEPLLGWYLKRRVWSRILRQLEQEIT
jgi:hypothetical protein